MIATAERSNEMLDTVILQILTNQYSILLKERFMLAGTKRGKNGIIIYRKYVNNATPEEIEKDIYRPCLTQYERFGERPLNIQFSAQKVLYSNSLQELEEAQFEELLNALQRSLFEMGVSIEMETLRYAKVMSFHPAKNIPITGGYLVQGIIKDFTKINLTGKMDLNRKEFENGGHGVQFYSKSHALTFYDKIKDLEKSDRKSYDTDQKLQQNTLFDFLQHKGKLEVLRMEVRLSEKVKMNSVLQKIGYAKNPTFIDIFKREIWQKVLLDYFQTYIEPNLFIFEITDDPQRILQNTLRRNPKMKTAQAMKLVALKMFCKADGGVRGLRSIIEPRAGERRWQRVTADIKTLNRRIPLKSCYGYIKEIKQTLQKFKPYKLEISEKLSTCDVNNNQVS